MSDVLCLRGASLQSRRGRFGLSCSPVCSAGWCSFRKSRCSPSGPERPPAPAGLSGAGPLRIAGLGFHASRRGVAPRLTRVCLRFCTCRAARLPARRLHAALQGANAFRSRGPPTLRPGPPLPPGPKPLLPWLPHVVRS